MKEKWDSRYSGDNYFYGEKPNAFIKERLDLLKAGKIIFFGEGEGRNAVYAASAGWDADAVDYSVEGKRKSDLLARKKGVKINYTVMPVEEFDCEENKYDAAAYSFLHLPPGTREILHSKMTACVKPGGIVLLEAFSQDQINFNSGGPKTLSLLYSLEDIATDLIDLDILLFEKKTVTLTESSSHSGPGSVIRFVGQKF